MTLDEALTIRLGDTLQRVTKKQRKPIGKPFIVDLIIKETTQVTDDTGTRPAQTAMLFFPDMPDHPWARPQKAVPHMDVIKVETEVMTR